MNFFAHLLGVLVICLGVGASHMAQAQSGPMDALESQFDWRWMECSGVCCTPEPVDPLGGGGGCTPNPTGCATILNECSYPIQVQCGVQEKAAAYFKAVRKEVKCAGEVDEKTMQRAPDEWIH